MDWQTVLRATVPLGAALLALVAVFAARRDRAAHAHAAAPAAPAMPAPAAATSDVAGFSRARIESAPSDDSPPTGPRRSARGPRALAGLVLVLLLGATGLVFTLSRPLADVDIEAVSLTDAHCRAPDACPGPPRVSARGTVATATGRDATVLVLVKSARGEWSVGAEAQPDENGDWAAPDVSLPPGAGPTLEVRAVLKTPSRPGLAERTSEAAVPAAVPASRVVRATVEVPAVQAVP